MFDFFLEICENASQYVTNFNWCLETTRNFLNQAFQNEYVMETLDYVRLLPAPFSGIFLTGVSIVVFDFIRGR